MRVPDDWFVGFHKGLAARFWAAAGETMIDADARDRERAAAASARCSTCRAATAA